MLNHVAELTEWARPHIENINTALLVEIPAAGFPAEQQRLRTQYTQVFRQRMDGMLRDVEIGLRQGQKMTTQDTKSVQANAFALLKILADATAGRAEPVMLEMLSNLGMSVDEAKVAFQYLKDKGLIRADYGVYYSASVSARGHDAIASAEKAPDQPIQSFPNITYNYSMTVHNMIGSNVQQGTTGSQISAEQKFDIHQLVEKVDSLVSQLERAIGSSDLPEQVKVDAGDAIAELRSATHAENPEAGRIRKGLEVLKSVLEHAAGHLVATGALTLIGHVLGSMPPH